METFLQFEIYIEDQIEKVNTSLKRGTTGKQRMQWQHIFSVLSAVAHAQLNQFDH